MAGSQISRIQNAGLKKDCILLLYMMQKNSWSYNITKSLLCGTTMYWGKLQRQIEKPFPPVCTTKTFIFKQFARWILGLNGNIVIGPIVYDSDMGSSSFG